MKFLFICQQDGLEQLGHTQSHKRVMLVTNRNVHLAIRESFVSKFSWGKHFA